MEAAPTTRSRLCFLTSSPTPLPCPVPGFPANAWPKTAEVRPHLVPHFYKASPLPAGCKLPLDQLWKTRPVLKKSTDSHGDFFLFAKKKRNSSLFSKKLNLSKRRNVMTRLSCWHLHQQGQRAFPTTSFSTGAGHDVVGDHVWEHLQFKQ